MTTSFRYVVCCHRLVLLRFLNLQLILAAMFGPLKTTLSGICCTLSSKAVEVGATVLHS